REAIVGRIRSHPMARAVRIDKLDLAALEATLRVYRDPDRAWEAIPVLSMLGADPRALERAAHDLAARLRTQLPSTAVVEVRPTFAEAGGGALPGVELPRRGGAVAPPPAWVEPWRARRPFAILAAACVHAFDL